MKTVLVLLLAELKNAILRKALKSWKSFYQLLRRSKRKTKTFEIEYFLVSDLLHFIFEYLKWILSKKKSIF